MKICFLGLDNLPVLAPEFNRHGIGGEQVQQTLLAKALARRGFEISMVVYDYGQLDCTRWHNVNTHKAFRADAGLPILRFVYPRWITMWSAMRRADADIYYLSCAGMQLGLAALFCQRYGRKFVYRVAHDTDCEPDKLLIKYWRDKKLYEYGLRRANGILVQSIQQQHALRANYGLRSRVAAMLVEPAEKQGVHSIDVLWVNNLRKFKRPDLFLALAKKIPQLNFHMIGGDQPGSGELFEKIKAEAGHIENLTFHGRVPYHEIGEKYASARVFVNTSDTEGFPNSYLQAWIRGTPVVAFFDPDALIQREKLGFSVCSLDDMARAVMQLASNHRLWLDSSARCKTYMKRVYGENRAISAYLDMFRKVS